MIEKREGKMLDQKLCVGLNAQFGPALTEQISLLKKAGFHGFFVKWEHGMDLTDIARKAEEEGMLFQSIHGPFLRVCDLWEEKENTEDVLAELIECLEVCRKFHVPIMVCHAFIGFDRIYCPTRLGIENFERVIRAAEEAQVKIAFENTEGEEYLSSVMNHFRDHPLVGFCWDTGHEMCYNRGKDMLSLYGERLLCTHINDNLGISDPDGKIFWLDDLHLLPFDGIGDWMEMANRLKRHRYQGPLTFELLKNSKPGRHENDAYSQMSAEEYFCLAYERAAKFRALLEK